MSIKEPTKEHQRQFLYQHASSVVAAPQGLILKNMSTPDGIVQFVCATPQDDAAWINSVTGIVIICLSCLLLFMAITW